MPAIFTEIVGKYLQHRGVLLDFLMIFEEIVYFLRVIGRQVMRTACA
ncbi:hypothetical protein CRENPOLYSF1_1330002 [Crenothrix polyspora]|uniref:Uncharacterized protein n=1 Tax=Crenothrix polyspora TaxID=360316 RepID=A0A1R4H1H6_9GAMM|nr:hypothetical protein CRENPOLYSF1_1330002 [Crenothrix polyspora]